MEQDKAERVARLEAERAEYQEDRERREEYRAEIRSLRDELDDCAARRRKAEDEVDGLRRIIRVWEQHARRQGWELPEDPKDMRSA
jgi:chromosome segregation ATPase